MLGLVVVNGCRRDKAAVISVRRSEPPAQGPPGSPHPKPLHFPKPLRQAMETPWPHAP